VFSALRLGITDYFGKNNIRGPAVIGLSGGIDSAVTAVLAVEALGTARVLGISMPSEFSSAGSITDAQALADHLGISFTVSSIKAEHVSARAGDAQMINHFRQVGFLPVTEDVSDENVQARIRGRKLMKVANHLGGVVLATGNKSEMAVGYCTLYGDMCGGLAVISDVPKTLVYRLARWINRGNEIIPRSTIEKPPSAELRPNQFDQQVLPPYDTLDAIVGLYVDKMESVESVLRILDARGEDGKRYRDQYGHDLEQDVRSTCTRIDRNEFKRRQAPIGLKMTSKHFGYGWDMPVAQSYTK
jgi:NAD+ synthetase